jgi:hypothetical protein
MELVAERLSAFIGAHAPLPRAASPGYRIDRVGGAQCSGTPRACSTCRRRGALSPRAVWVRRVLQADGSPWRSSRDADVLLLGDSFTNIYALESMGWGTVGRAWPST